MRRPTSPPALRALLVPAVLVPLAFATSACGRRATREDCEAIVDRTVEVQLKAQAVTDPDLVATKKQEIRKELEPKLQDCVGKRVTDSTLGCVRTAETAEEIDKCLH